MLDPQAQLTEIVNETEPKPMRAPAEPVNALQAGSEEKNRIPGDVVNKATAELPDEQRAAIRRLHAYYAEHNLSLAETAELIGRSGATVGLIFRGKYEAKVDDVVGSIVRFFDLEDRRAQGRKLQFIHTKLSDHIWQICDSALELQRMAFVVGDGQVGKSESLLQYQISHNHGSTIYTRMPSDGHRSHFLIRVAKQLRISPAMKTAVLAERIMESFDSRMLWIVDEVHHCIKDTRSNQRLETIEFIREVFDLRKCGVVLCANSVLRESMNEGALSKFFEQTKRRRLVVFDVPGVPSREDLNTFSGSYGLPASKDKARELETQMVNDEALGMWLTLLRMAAKLAAQRKQKLTWEHVLNAHQGLKHLEGR